MDQVEYLTFPRATALSEINWSENLDYDDFFKRLCIFKKFFKEFDINYCKNEF